MVQTDNRTSMRAGLKWFNLNLRAVAKYYDKIYLSSLVIKSFFISSYPSRWTATQGFLLLHIFRFRFQIISIFLRVVIKVIKTALYKFSNIHLINLFIDQKNYTQPNNSNQLHCCFISFKDYMQWNRIQKFDLKIIF